MIGSIIVNLVVGLLVNCSSVFQN